MMASASVVDPAPATYIPSLSSAFEPSVSYKDSTSDPKTSAVPSAPGGSSQVQSESIGNAETDGQPPSDATPPVPRPAFPTTNQRLQSASEVTWKAFKECVKGEANYIIEDYKTMQEMNEHVSEKLRLSRDNFNKIGNEVQVLNDQTQQVEAYLKEIDVICEKIDTLEKAATGLDSYTRSLESTYKSILKQ